MRALVFQIFHVQFVIPERPRHMSNPNPPACAAHAPLWLIWLGVLALAGYGRFIERNFSIVAGGSDSSGYLNSARLMAAGELQANLRAPVEFGPVETLNQFHFLPLGFWPYTKDGKITPTYPTGLPIHFALAGKLTDWFVGPRLVGLFAALGAVWLCYAVGREFGLDARLAAAGAVTLAVCPVFLFTSFQPISDTLATTWALAAVWAGLRARRHAAWAIGCGLACGIAVLVRPTNLILLPTLILLLGLDWRRLALATAGGLPGVAWLAFYNNALYGGTLQSGYGDIFVSFAWSWGPITAWHFLKWLAVLLPTPLLLLPLFTLKQSERRNRQLLALAIWFAAFTGLYTFYVVSHETWWCLRFLLPGMPALIIAGLLGVEAIGDRYKAAQQNRFRTMAAVILACWAIGGSVYWYRHFALGEINNGEKTYAKACKLARTQFPADTLIVTFEFSGAFYYYTDFPILRWDQVEPEQFARYARLAQKAGRTIGAVGFRWEEQSALKEHCPGNWVRVGEVGDAVLWRLAAPTPPVQKP
jgi:hypothetical protein